MKFIHLSDLHLGKRVNEFSMLEDQEYILTKIINISNRFSKIYFILIIRKDTAKSCLAQFNDRWYKSKYKQRMVNQHGTSLIYLLIYAHG